MARCEDFPCCGHELGCCPDFDEGAKIPITSRYSICEGCLNRPDPDDPDSWYYDEPPEYEDDGMTDVEADADTLRSAGMGTDEDYGYYGEGDYDGT